MAKDKLTEYDATAANNTVVGDVNLAENSCLPSDLNNAVREVMSHQKEAFGSGTPLYVDQTNNNVLVGATSNNSANVGHGFQADGFVYHTRDGGAMLRLNRLTSNGDIQQFQKDGSTAGTIGTITSSGAPRLYIGNDDTSVLFHGGADNITPANGSGGTRDNAIDLGSSSARFKNLYLSGGAYIGGTGSANLLSDYEEGDWNPSLNESLTATSVFASYTKIGRMVFINCQLVVPSNSSSSITTISGLPFAVTTSHDGAATLAFTQASTSAAMQIQLQSSSVFFYGDGGGAFPLSSFSNKHLRFSGLYRTG